VHSTLESGEDERGSPCASSLPDVDEFVSISEVPLYRRYWTKGGAGNIYVAVDKPSKGGYEMILFYMDCCCSILLLSSVLSKSDEKVEACWRFPDKLGQKTIRLSQTM
jgi:hypothetical protein